MAVARSGGWSIQRIEAWTDTVEPVTLTVLFEPWESPVSGSWHLGNDIVDLADRRHVGKAGDHRFLQRVFTPKEQETILESLDPDHTLWLLWAAKESAFKTVSKFLGTPPTFNHGLFQVSLFGKPSEAPEPDTPPESTAHGNRPSSTVGKSDTDRGVIPVRIEVNGPSLHALTWFPDSSGSPPRYSWGWEAFPEEAGRLEGPLRTPVLVRGVGVHLSPGLSDGSDGRQAGPGFVAGRA